MTPWLITFKWTPSELPDRDRLELVSYRLEHSQGELMQPTEPGIWRIRIVVRSARGSDAVPKALTLVAGATGARSGQLHPIDAQPAQNSAPAS